MTVMTSRNMMKAMYMTSDFLGHILESKKKEKKSENILKSNVLHNFNMQSVYNDGDILCFGEVWYKSLKYSVTFRHLTY